MIKVFDVADLIATQEKLHQFRIACKIFYLFDPIFSEFQIFKFSQLQASYDGEDQALAVYTTDKKWKCRLKSFKLIINTQRTAAFNSAIPISIKLYEML